jgi:predicted alpha/beta superfamily hydrolase
MRRTVVSASLLLSLLPMVAAGQSSPAPKPALTVGRLDSVWSETLNENRPLLVYTPPSYDSSAYLPRRYPVMYLLDGSAHFESVSGLMQILSTGVNGAFVIPQMIVVAIPNTHRTRDLTPTHSDVGPDGDTVPSFKTSGGGPAFLRFLRTELIPHIDSTYRTTDYRVFVGHSFGGITVVDALYTMPETFNAYVAIDPSLWWDHQMLLKEARSFFGKPEPPGRTLFVAQANTIEPGDTTVNLHYASILLFNDLLQSSNKSGIRYGYRYFPDDSHGSVPLIAEYDALRFIFDGYFVDPIVGIKSPRYLTNHFAEVSTRLGTRMLPPESMVDLLAQAAPSIDSTKVMGLLQLNADLYPDSPHALNSLGDALLAKGDTAKAVAEYRKVLGLQPVNNHAAEQVRKLGGGGR